VPVHRVLYCTGQPLGGLAVSQGSSILRLTLSITPLVSSWFTTDLVSKLGSLAFALLRSLGRLTRPGVVARGGPVKV
jgi:hypothetical protein